MKLLTSLIAIVALSACTVVNYGVVQQEPGVYCRPVYYTINTYDRYGRINPVTQYYCAP